MTPEEINDLKVEISKTISERMEKAFVGQSMANVSAELVKCYLQEVMKDFLAQGYHPVVGLIDYSVRFEGNTMHVVMEPKRGLSNEDHARAVNFLFNQEFY